MTQLQGPLEPGQDMARPPSRACYVLTCDSWNSYAAMCCVSALSLRRGHSDVEISVLIDSESLSRLGAGRKLIEKTADRVIAVGAVDGSSKVRSRVLKTTMRRVMQGEFLFLDLDTIVLGDLYGLFSASRTIGLALENNVANGSEYQPKRVFELYKALGWANRPLQYFNSGVMCVGDNDEAHRLFAEWHNRWQITRKVGRDDDQPALNMAIHELGVKVDVLPWHYNAMVLFYPKNFRSARVAHFFASNRQGGTLLSHLVAHFERTGELDEAAIDAAIVSGHPWGPHAEPYQLWRSGNYSSAIAGKLRRFVFGHGLPAGRKTLEA